MTSHQEGPRTRQIEEDLNAISRFSTVMLEKLNENRHKPHWGGFSADWLFMRAQNEIEELSEAIEHYYEIVGSSRSDSDQIRKAQMEVRRECADVANFCMMISDNLDPARMK